MEQKNIQKKSDRRKKMIVGSAVAAETAALTENIKKAESVSREPVYRQRAASRSAQDWGVTYVEVDLTAQHMWYVKDGSVQLESDVVTGARFPRCRLAERVRRERLHLFRIARMRQHARR